MTGDEARRRRKALNWSAAKLARAADVSEPTVRAFENSTRVTHPAVVKAIEEAIQNAEAGAEP